MRVSFDLLRSRCLVAVVDMVYVFIPVYTEFGLDALGIAQSVRDAVAAAAKSAALVNAES